jgi:soluble lytic murein transglycosylase-like protein
LWQERPVADLYRTFARQQTFDIGSRSRLALRLIGLVLAAGLVACSGPGSRFAASDTSLASPSAAPSATDAAATPTASPSPSPAPTASAAPKWDEVPVAAMDPAELATQLVMVETAIRDPNLSAAHLEWMGHLQQLAYSRLQDYPDWKPTVLGALPEQTRASVVASLDAGKQLRLLSGPIPKSLPDWKIVPAKPVDELLGYYKEAEAEFGVPWYYLASVHLVESRMGRIRGLSSAGAQGPMQFIPSTWAQYGNGGDINDDHDAIIGAARYLKAAGAPGNMQKALYAYNHSQAYVNALLGYGNVMKADPTAYRGYHGWQVYYPTVDGAEFLPVGWTKP